MRNADGALEGFACVHVGCDDVYSEETEWREHVFDAHHGIQRAPKTDRVDDEVLDKAWRGHARA